MANASLMAKLGLNTKAFQKGLTNAQRRVGKFGKSINKTLGGMKGAFLSIAGIGAFGAITKGGIDLADQLKKTADRLGLTTDELQAFTNASKLSGINVTTASLGLQRFTRRLAEAQADTGELKGILEEYGVATKDSTGQNRSAMSVLKELADIMSTNSSQAENLRIAFKAFDSEGADLVRILDQGADGFEQLAESGNRMFGTFSKSQIEQLSETKTQLEAIGSQATIVAGKLLQLSGVDKLLKGLSEGITGIPVTKETDLFAKIFDPKKPEEFKEQIMSRLIDPLRGGIEDLQSKEVFSKKDLEAIATEFLKIQGSVRDVSRFGAKGSAMTRQEIKGIRELRDEFIKIQDAKGKGAILSRLEEAIQGRIDDRQADIDKKKNNINVKAEMQKAHEEQILELKDLQLEAERNILRAKATGSKEAVEQAERESKTLDQTIELMEDFGILRGDAINLAKQIIKGEEKINEKIDEGEKFQNEKNKLLAEELKLVGMLATGSDKEISAQEKKIAKMQRILELQEKFNVSREKAIQLAEGELAGDIRRKAQATGIGDPEKVSSRDVAKIANKMAKAKGMDQTRFERFRDITGEDKFRRLDSGRVTGEFTEQQMRERIGEEAVGEESEVADLIKELIEVSKGKFVNE